MRIIIADPAKNITAFVLDKVERTRYHTITSLLRGLPEHGIEEVAFVCQPILGGDGRIEMLGSAFCCNAVRSYGVYMANKARISGKRTLRIEVGGYPLPIDVEVDLPRNHARTAAPLPLGVRPLVVGDKMYQLVMFEKMIHVIAEEDPSDAVFERITSSVLNSYDPEGGVGVMFLTSDREPAEELSGPSPKWGRTQTVSFSPIVYVCENDTVTHESSCASGAGAVAVYLSDKKPDNIYRYYCKQPGGTVNVELMRENSKVSHISVGGEISFSDEINIELDIM